MNCLKHSSGGIFGGMSEEHAESIGTPNPAGNGNHLAKETATSGITFGCALAICISWSVHHSVLWAMFQGVLSWIYVIYYVLTAP